MAPDANQVLHRIAIVGDIHAEDQLLELALRWIASHGDVDLIACTGDVVDGLGSVSRCCTFLRAYSVQCVRGNHDRWLFTEVLRDSHNATRREDLDTADQQFLQALPTTRDLRIPSGVMLLCHGIGSFDLEKITSYDTDYSLKANRRLQSIIASRKYRVMVNGHSHERLLTRVGELVIINAGTLSGDIDPGFVLLDFLLNLSQWYSIRDSRVTLAAEHRIF